MKAKLNSSSLVACFLGLLFVSAMPALSPSVLRTVTDPQSTARAKVARIPFELNGNHIYIKGRVNNSEPLWIVLDTGAAASVINTSRARELGLEIREGFRAQGAGGTVESGQVSGVSINLGEVSLNNLTIGTIPLTSLEDLGGRRMDVILGYELFKSFVVEINYETHQIALHDPKTFDYTGSGEALPLTFTQNHPYVRARIVVPGREPIEGEFVIDTGSNFAVTLLPSFTKTHDILKSIPKTVLSRGRGVGGEIPLPTGRIEKLQMGRFTLDNPVTTFPPRGTFGREGKAGNIGSAVMRRFRLIFDYSRQRMILEPNKDFRDPFEFDMSGLSLITDSPEFKSMRVFKVLDASPADEAGVKSGDEILAINNRPAAEFKLMNVRELLKQEGRSVQLRIKRNEEILSLAFKTRRLI